MVDELSSQLISRFDAVIIRGLPFIITKSLNQIFDQFHVLITV
ncbi:hypothetical protein CES86_5312 [Brucella lupini]|uniref:Uncharacterized protein n=1 Tax=Brucella lupini TaxID=255457 RepID=A0A256H0J8_9HYPH|nr:hypothetical protein CES86_5312 [Brucella lupini]